MRASIVTVSVIAMMAVVPAFAQTESYETPKYMTSPPTVLDPNYGLPSFGMPGAELPWQRTLAPEAGPPDFFKDRTDVTLPKTGSSSTETPLYTTAEGGTTGEDTTSAFETK